MAIVAGDGRTHANLTITTALAAATPTSILSAVNTPTRLLTKPYARANGTFVPNPEITAVKQRLDADDLTVLAFRFEGDPYCQAVRFDTLARELGDRFVARVIPDSAAGASGWLGVPHSVVTTSLIDEAGQPTAAARDEILGILSHRLLAS